MVGTIKRWLNIDLLELETRALQGANAARVEEILILTDRIRRMEELKQLTSSPPKPKIEPKPHRANWRTFRSAAEKASDEQEQEA